MTTALRTVRPLDGIWQLHLPSHSDPVPVTVPGSWTTQIDGAGDAHETVRYSRSVELAEPAGDKRLVLRFAAVNHHATVTLNGVEVGEGGEGWLPFEVDITDAARPGENTLDVVVSYPPRFGDSGQTGFLEEPLGKQSWYGTNAGIWQSVTLEERDAAHVRDIRVAADAETGAISIDGTLAHIADERVEVVVSQDGLRVAAAEATLAGRAFHSVVGVDDPVLWDLDDPQRYDVDVRVLRDGVVVDSIRRTTGFRTFAADDGRFFLNGREVYLRAVLDQDYHPGSALAPEDFEEWERLLVRTRELGFNMLRVHIKRPDPHYYEIADRIGILVWTELPSWMTWTPATAERGIDLLHRLMAADGHHPSIVIWTIMNESWGIDLSDPTQREWLRAAFDDISARAGSALVVDNSACEPNFHLCTDIDDYHVYRGIPEARRVWDAKIAEFARRPEWTFSPYGDAERTGDEPLVLSEFGNWGLPHALDQYDAGREPWWFALGAHWAFGAAEGTGLLPRFRSLGLEDVFGSWDELIRQLHHAQLVANRYQTTSIRLHDEIRGYVLTQLSDVQWEANGLFDMNRTPKAGTAEWALANGEHAVAVRPAAYSANVGEAIAAVVTTLPGPAGLPDGALLRVRVGERVVLEQPAARSRETVRAEIPLPEAGQHALTAELLRAGQVIARDSADLIVVGAQRWTGEAVRAADDAVRGWLRSLDVPESDGADLLVTRRFDEAARAHAAAGGRVLLLIEDDAALDSGFDYLPSARLGSRAGDGDWVPRTEWLDRRGAFAGVPGDAVLGIAFEDLLGELVISGIPGPLRAAHVHSGIFSGWLRGAATSTATVRWSRGAVTMTTMRVRHADAAVARAVSLGMLRAASEAVVAGP